MKYISYLQYLRHFGSKGYDAGHFWIISLQKSSKESSKYNLVKYYVVGLIFTHK
jgi:hypothetical protein